MTRSTINRTARKKYVTAPKLPLAKCKIQLLHSLGFPGASSMSSIRGKICLYSSRTTRIMNTATDCLVATGYRLNPKLGMWVANSGTDTRK
jgi:hypothetical protein